MDTLLEFFMSLLDTLFYSLISPAAVKLGNVMELLLLEPLELLHVPPILQIGAIGVLTAALSLVLRKLLKSAEKDEEFRTRFSAKKAQQEELHRLGNWQVEEKLRKTIDDDIDEDFNTYLAGRFARYGIAYLLPIFMVLYWLQAVTDYEAVAVFPSAGSGESVMPVMVVYLVFYGVALALGFRKIKQKKQQTGNVQHR